MKQLLPLLALIGLTQAVAFQGYGTYAMAGGDTAAVGSTVFTVKDVSGNAVMMEANGMTLFIYKGQNASYGGTTISFSNTELKNGVLAATLSFQSTAPMASPTSTATPAISATPSPSPTPSPVIVLPITIPNGTVVINGQAFNGTEVYNASAQAEEPMFCYNKTPITIEVRRERFAGTEKTVFRLTVENKGVGPAKNVVVQETLPSASITFKTPPLDKTAAKAEWLIPFLSPAERKVIEYEAAGDVAAAATPPEVKADAAEPSDYALLLLLLLLVALGAAYYWREEIKRETVPWRERLREEKEKLAVKVMELVGKIRRFVTP